MSKKRFSGLRLILMVPVVVLLAGGLIIGGRALQEPGEVRTLKRQEVAQTDEGHQEYYFGLLNENEQRGYREILEGIRSFEDKFYLSLSGDNEIDRVYHAVLKDHPELFWVHNREKVYKTTYSGRDYCQFSPGYTYTEEQRQEITQAMENAYQEVLSQIPDGADDYTKVMTVYTYVIDNTEYVISDDDQSIAGAFWKKQAVCAGYAGAVQYLLERLGIPCTTVTGNARGESHAWNLVQMDGEYYYIDTTWGNSQYMYQNEQNGAVSGETGISKFPDYDYFGATTQTILKTHTPDSEIPLPDCTAVEDNYFIHQGLYVESWDVNRIGEMIGYAYDSGQAAVQIKFSSVELCEQAMQYFVEDSHLFDYCEEIESVQYLENSENAVMVLLFPTNAE